MKTKGKTQAVKPHTLKQAYALGFKEADSDMGMTYDNDPGSPRSVAYDKGREAGMKALGRLEPQAAKPSPGQAVAITPITYNKAARSYGKMNWAKPQAVNSSPLPWAYPTETARPWRAVCMPSGAIYIKGPEGCRVAELRMPLKAMNANNAALLVRAINSHGPMLDALKVIAMANPASTVMGLQQVALATLRAAGEEV